MTSWFKCRACTARCTSPMSLGVSTFCPSCGRPTLEPCEEFGERPTQSPLFFLPDVPRAIRWKIEWQWTPACRQNTQEIFNETLPEGWFFHSEYSTERQAVNALSRLRRRDAPNRYCTIRARHHRMKPCLWSHSGDIELVLSEKPPAPIPSDFDLIDQLIADDELIDILKPKPVAIKKSEMSDEDDAPFSSTFQSMYLDPHCGPDFCVKDGCPIHGTPDPWDETQIESLVTKS